MDPLFLEALRLVKDLSNTPKNIGRISDQTSVEAAHWAFTQKRLRKKALHKFEFPEKMLFTQEALEQATHFQVAKYRASCFPRSVKIADLTCGIGGDLLAFAERGKAVGFEFDPERAKLAKYNVKNLNRSAEVVHADSLTSCWDFDYAFADPARRVNGQRTLKLEEFTPDPRILAERFKRLKLAAIKLSPMLSDETLLSLGGKVEFVSFGDQCREALLWYGTDLPVLEEKSQAFQATHVESKEVLFSLEDSAYQSEPKKYIYEADPAAIRSHSLGTLCHRFGIFELGDSKGYLTGDHLLQSPWLTSYTVLWHGWYHPKKIRKELLKLGNSLLAVKLRGVSFDPSEILKELKPSVKGENTLFLYRIHARVHAILCQKLTLE